MYADGTPLDLIGPLQVLGALGKEYRCVVISDTLQPVLMDVPIKVQATAALVDVPHPDVLVIPGGIRGTYRVMHDAPLLEYVRTASETASHVLSICTGALILGAAGLLHGRDATTHWAAAKLLEEYGARYVRERWVERGTVITAAGVSAGIDAALYLAARLAGHPYARSIQAWIEYDPQPPFGPMDWSLANVDLLPRDWFEQRVSTRTNDSS